ncbi:MAG: outer membrane beta-barrel protein [Gemmatimonadales bacterium]
MKTALVRGVAMGVALALSAHVAQAQGTSLGFGGGAAVPTGSFGDAATTGWSSQLVARVKPGSSPVGLQVDGFYNRFGLEGGIDGNTRLMGGTANAVFAFPGASRARPYLIGGVGLYNGKVSVLGTSASQTDFGANAGAGFDVAVGKRAAVFAEGRFHAIFMDETAYMVPVTLGLRWSLQ